MLKRLIFIILPTLIICGLIRIGMFAGEYYALFYLREEVDRMERERCLAGVLRPSQLKVAAQAYLNVDQAGREMGHYSWLVPSVPSPFVGAIPQPGVFDNARINNLQCRADREVTLPKERGAVRVFLIGGSVAYGSGAPSQQYTIGGWLESLLNARLQPATGRRYEVFTQANPGWATTHERIITENRLVDCEPDLVVALSGFNDMHYGQAGRNILWYRLPQEDLFFGLNNQVREWTGRSRWPSVVPPDQDPIAPAIVARRLRHNVRLAALALSDRDIPFAYCLQPCLAVTGKPLSTRERNLVQGADYARACYREIQQSLATLELPLFAWHDLTDVCNGRRAVDEIFLDNCHFGDKGNILIAERLFHELRVHLPK